MGIIENQQQPQSAGPEGDLVEWHFDLAISS